MRIEFLKMQGLGNDFLVFDAPAAAAAAKLDATKLRALGDRHTGVGFDQALMLETPRDADTRAFYRVFNADGTEVEQCGNGARCVAALLYARAPELGRDFRMGSLGGVVHARVTDDGMVSVDMGIPDFNPRALPFEPERGAVAPGDAGRGAEGPGAALAEAPFYSLSVDGAELEIGAVSMGNPHAVLQVSDVKSAPLARFGPSIENHPRFPRRTNVGFMQIVSRNHIRLRVFERGVGETLACGTGACAAVAVGRRRGLLDADVRVDLPGGTAKVSWAAAGGHIWLTGPATTVFTGSIDIT
jgi:diaminopimelate epimerase